MSVIIRSVACSSASVTVKLAPPEVVKSIGATPLLGRRQRRGLRQREYAGHGGALSHHRDDRNSAAMEFHERTDQGEPNSRTAMLRAQRICFKPVKHFFKHVGRYSGSPVGDREYHRVGTPFGQQRDGRA